MSHVSVVIPAYNRAHLIGATLESVLAQTHRDIDIVVVDDASRDGTPDVVRKYCQSDPRLKLLVNSENLGLTGNWNRCLGLATGPLVQSVLSDDLVDSDYLASVVKVYERHPGAGMVAASCRYIDGNGRVIGEGQAGPDKYWPAGDEAVTALLTDGYPHVTGIVARKECYDTLGLFDETIWHGPDMEMACRIASRYGYFRFGSPKTSFRRHGSNMGALEYLRQDFLEVDSMKRRKTWSYLSPAGLARMGIPDLENHLGRIRADVAVGGAIVALAYGQSALSRWYLAEARSSDPGIRRNPRYWRARLAGLVPRVGRAVLERRMGITRGDRERAKVVVSESLAAR